MIRRMSFAISVLVACGSVSLAEVVSFRFGQDLTGTTTPYTSSQDTWFSGTSQNFGTNTRGYVRNANIEYLLRFDDIIGNSPGMITPAEPGGQVVVTSATLTLDRTSQAAPGLPANLHRVLVDWDDAPNNPLVPPNTGLSNFNTPTGAYPGTNVAGGNITGILDSGTSSDPDVFDVTSIVSGWANGTFPNFGFALTNPNGSGGGATNGDIVFGTNEVALANRPLLTVEFFVLPPPLTPEPASLALWTVLGGGVGLAWWRRRRLARLQAGD